MNIKKLKLENTSVWLALGLTIGAALWLAGGTLVQGRVSEPAAATDAAPRTGDIERLFLVEVEEQAANDIERAVVLQGHSAPNRAVTVRAETSGRVIELLVQRGNRVRAGDVVVRLALDERTTELEQARALVRQRAGELASAKSLGTKGYTTKANQDELAALLARARADLDGAERNVARTELRAPFDGILNERSVEQGDYIAKNDPVFTVVDDHPLVVNAQLPQQHAGRIVPGMAGDIRFLTGQEIRGRTRYVSATAAAATRTFAIELEIPNPEGALPAGISTEIRIPFETVSAHRVSPALLVLGPGGELGLHTVDDESRVAFLPVAIVRAGGDGIWISGLPTTARIITVGQGFVRAGERVGTKVGDAPTVSAAQ